MNSRMTFAITAAALVLMGATACQPSPEAPPAFTGSLTDGGGILLRWEGVSAEGVVLRRTDASGMTDEIGQFGAIQGVFTDGTAACGESYQYLLTAYSGDSVASETCLFITLPADCLGSSEVIAVPCTDPPPADPICGDGICNGLESPIKCPEDCGVMIPSPTPLSVCGDGLCTGLESPIKCPEDCGSLITPTPPQPTAAGPTAVGPTSVATLVPTLVYTLVPTLVPTVVPVCGNGTCEAGESFATCQSDCPTICGDGVCEGLESSIRCPQDCGVMITPPATQPPVCGDGVCNGTETILSCPADCPMIIITFVPFPNIGGG